MVRSLLAAVVMILGAAAGHAGCRLALVLALDVSGSVDAREYRLQLDGIAEALNDPAVRTALMSNRSSAVQVLIFEWSGVEDYRVLVDWTPITDADQIAEIQNVLHATKRAPSTPGTALGDAMVYAGQRLAERQHCTRLTLDVSGDGKANMGIAPSVARDRLAEAGILTNALVIGADAPNSGDLRQAEISELSSYFRTNVISGPGAFVQTALGYEAYGMAMARKLERELGVILFSVVAPNARARPMIARAMPWYVAPDLQGVRHLPSSHQ